MSGWGQALPLIGHVLLLAVWLTLLLQRFVQPTLVRRYVFILLIILNIFVFIGGLNGVQWLRSLLGDLSMLTWLLLANILLQRWFGRSLLDVESRKMLLAGVLLVGAIFYPMALGLGQYDPYRLGYAPQMMALMLAIISVIAWLLRKPGLALGMLLPLFAFQSGWFESSNLWDYVLDPVIFIYALVQSLISTTRSFGFIRGSDKL